MSTCARDYLFAISLLVALPLFAGASIAYSQTFQSAGFFVVVDATQKKVGDVISLARSDDLSIPIVAFQLENYPPFALQVFRDRLVGNGSMNALYFPSGDCSGTPFVLLDTLTRLQNRLMLPVAVAAPGSTVYAADPLAIAQPVVKNSALILEETAYDSEPPLCIASDNQVSIMVPLVPILSLDLLFIPPFSLQVAAYDIDSFNQFILDLRADLDHHSHVYLTGKGEGHNNTEAVTGPPVFP
ncbi:MAG TPA: hypothetical protein VNN09_07660 [Candidatus Competibacteraceae bacterium]|nr:hypothetical protein [Candidatus Competibacteraceae bacterium]